MTWSKKFAHVEKIWYEIRVNFFKEHQFWYGLFGSQVLHHILYINLVCYNWSNMKDMITLRFLNVDQ